MESFKSTIAFGLAISLSKSIQDKIRQFVKSLKDVEILELNPDHIKLEYYPQLYSEGYLETSLKQLGVSFIKNTDKKGFFKKWLDKLAKDNKETFGEDGLECCKLHKN